MPRTLSAGTSDQGNVRGNNEDRIHIDDTRGIYLVVDGMGGQAAGEEAAEIAVKTMRGRLERPTDSTELRVREAIALANNEIYKAARENPAWGGMACVLTVAVVEDGTATVGHVGDSRLYQIRRGSIRKITSDHSPVGEREDSGELSEVAAMKHPRRNEVYRDVGSAPRTPDDADFIEVKQIPFPQDSALLLCSDGLSDVLTANQILQTVEQHAGDRWAAVRKLAAAAVEEGKDNVSLVLVEGEKFASSVGAPDAHPPAIPAAVPRGHSWWSGRAAWALAACLLTLAGVWGAQLWMRPRAVAPVRPTVLRVAPQGSEFASVVGAVDQAQPGDIIEIAAGEYAPPVALKSAVTLRGTGQVILSGGITADAVKDARVTGLVVGAGIRIRDSEVVLDHLEVHGGITFEGVSKGAVRFCQISGSPGPGIAVRGTSSPLIEHNIITGNGGPGIEFLSSAPPVLLGNGIGGNKAEPLWLAAAPDETMLANNILGSQRKPFKMVKP